MASPNQDADREAFRNLLVVDCDVHISKRDPALLRKKLQYMEEPYRSQLDPDHELHDSPYPNDGWPRNVPATNTAATTTSVVDPDENVRQPLLDEFGVDYPILNTGGNQDLLPETDRALQEVRADNHLLVEAFLDGNDEFFGLMDICTRVPHKAAEEIDEWGSEDQIVGVYVSSQSCEKPMGHPQNDVVLQAAEDNGLTMVYHGGDTAVGGTTPDLDAGLESFAAHHAVSHPYQQMVMLSSLVMQGAPVKFPDLDHVFLDAGLGWAHYTMARLNREYGQRRSDAPLLEKQPEEYVRERCYFSTQPFEEYLDPGDNVKTMELLGPENVVFSTGHPNFDFDHPRAMDRFYKQFSEAERKKMLHGNAIEAFDLPISA